MDEYVRTDTAEDLAATLELAGEFISKSRDDQRYWKWLIAAMHSGVQSAASLALERGNGFLVQKPAVMQRMLDAHAKGTEPVTPHMDNFSRLIEKALLQQNLRCNAAPLKDCGHVNALRSLDELRDGFAHFNVKSWSIETMHILECATKALEFIDHYACITPAILWHDELHQSRVKQAICSLQKSVKDLCAEAESLYTDPG
jgi:hypothetical protein